MPLQDANPTPSFGGFGLRIRPGDLTLLYGGGVHRGVTPGACREPVEGAWVWGDPPARHLEGEWVGKERLTKWGVCSRSAIFDIAQGDA